MLSTEAHLLDGQRALFVAHQAVIMVCRYVLEGLDEQELMDLDKREQIANASLTRYDADPDGGWELRQFNHVDHIRVEDEDVTKEPDVQSAARALRARRRPRHPAGAARRGALPVPTGGKESRGSILVIGGSSETLGAVLLAAEAALRAGAGKLQVATAESVAPFAATALPEALVRRLPETQRGAIRADAADEVRDLAESASAVLLGPGMIDTEETQALGAALLPSLSGPLVLDALGLACVTADAACLAHLGGRAVLTPNPKELALSLHRDPDDDLDDPAGPRAGARRGRPCRRRPGRCDLVGGGAGRPALARRERRSRAGRLRVRRRPCRASPPACWPAAPSPTRPPSGRRTCTGGRGAARGVRGAAGLPGPRAAARGAAGDRRDRELTAHPGCPCAGVVGMETGDSFVGALDFGSPSIDDAAFVAPTAVVVGAVTMGPRASIWYGAVARADAEVIEIGEGSNIQDGCTLHSDAGFPLVVGRGVTVGHRVVLHGARVDDDVLVGMGSVVMNGAHIGSGSIIAAGAVVTQGKEFPPRSVIAGVPARVVREATDDDLLHITGNAASYTDRLDAARRVRRL